MEGGAVDCYRQGLGRIGLGGGALRSSAERERRSAGDLLSLLVLLVAASELAALRGQTAPPRLIAPGVWFLLGDAQKGYSNTAVIEMQDYLIVVDANYPGRARELIAEVKQLSPKPVRYVFDTHAHGDHTYGNSVWTAAGATTIWLLQDSGRDGSL